MAQSPITSSLEQDTVTMDEELDLDLLLFTEEEEEFMVVPTLEDLTITLEDLLSEETFNVLTVDDHQNPSVVFVVDVERASSSHNLIGDGLPSDASNSEVQNSLQYNSSQGQQFQYVDQPFSYDMSDSSSAPNKPNAASLGMGFGEQASLGPQFQQQHYNELTDPTANWVTETTDVTMLERFVTENDRFRSVDDIMNVTLQDQSIQPVTTTSFSTSQSLVLDKDQILEEIYREAEEISSRQESPVDFSPGSNSTGWQLDVGNDWEGRSSRSVSISNSSDGDVSMDSYHPPSESGVPERKAGRGTNKKQRKVTPTELSDSDYSPASVSKRGRKQRAPNREVAKQKKRHQNREAALRYRLKKRVERMETTETLSTLVERNESLKSQKFKLAAEIAYLQGLLSEVNKKKIRS